MAITAGVLSLVSVAQTTASLSATAATGGTGPYTYQWYRSTVSGFTPSGANDIVGATSLTLSDTGLLPGTLYYYKMIAIDTGHSNDPIEYAQLAVTTVITQSLQNQFQQAPYLGQVDQQLNFNTHPVQIDASQATPLFAGAAVKMVDSAGGVPKVIGCAADDDQVLGFINFDIKSVSFAAGVGAEISMAGNVMYLMATATFARGAQLAIDPATTGGVLAAAGDARYVGWAYDKASAVGQLVRVYIVTPSYTLVA